MATARAHVRVGRAPSRVSTRVRRTSPRQGPRAPEHLVERMVVEAILVVTAYTDRLMRALEPLLQERFGVRQDAASLDEVFERVQEGHVSREFLARMFRLTDQQAANDLSRVVPISPGQTLRGAAEMQAAFIERNTELIQLEERARKEVRAIIEGPIGEGVRVEDIREQIQERMGVVRSRAELIARDQTLKTYGQIQEARQTDAGIEEYTWSTSDDERVRSRHLELEGTTQRWDAPPVVDPKTGRREHPGGDFQCRCAAIPILPTGELPDEPPPTGRRRSVPPPSEPEPPTVPDPPEFERQRLAELEREAERQRQLAEVRLSEERRLAEARRAAEEARLAAERDRLEREARQQRTAEARDTIERYAERVQFDTLASVEMREAAAKAIEKVGLRNMAVVKVAPNTGVASAEGLYSPLARDVIVKSEGYSALGVPLPDVPGPGKVFSMGTHPATQAAALRNTVYHELGHHAHLHANQRFSPGSGTPAQRVVAARVNSIIEQRWVARDREYLTDYAQDPDTPSVFRASEYFAEAFAAYHAEPLWLRRVAPRAFAMVEDVLRLRKESQ